MPGINCARRINRKTTNEHFKHFVEFCEAEIKAFGLTDWEVYYYHEDLPDNAAAQTEAHHEARVAYISLTTDWGKTPITSSELQRVAYHEICELLLVEYAELVNRRDDMPFEALKAMGRKINHTVIHRLSSRYHKQGIEEISFSSKRLEAVEAVEATVKFAFEEE